MKKKNYKTLLLVLLSSLAVSSCQNPSQSSTPSINGSENNSSESISADNSDSNSNSISEDIKDEIIVDKSHRKDRDFSKFPVPSNEINENELPAVTDELGKVVVLSDQNLSMVNGQYRLDFTKNSSNKYVLQLVNIKNIAEVDNATSSNVMFKNDEPVRVFLKGSNQTIKGGYDTVEKENSMLPTIEEAKKELAGMGILEMANDQAEALIKGLLQDVVPKDYEIKIKK